MFIVLEAKVICDILRDSRTVLCYIQAISNIEKKNYCRNSIQTTMYYLQMQQSFAIMLLLIFNSTECNCLFTVHNCGGANFITSFYTKFPKCSQKKKEQLYVKAP